MESLTRLTRRQLETLQAIGRLESPTRGASLNAIAQSLGVRPPSALLHLGPLEEDRLVERRRGKSRLTPRGLRCLQEYERHHRVVETLFGRLGFPPEETCEAAREIDLAISHRTVEKLCRAEAHPMECPHGAPIRPCRAGTPPAER